MQKKVEMPLWFYVFMIVTFILNIGNFVIDKVKDDPEPIVRVFYNGVEVKEVE